MTLFWEVVLGISMILLVAVWIIVWMLKKSIIPKGPMPKRHGGFGSNITGSAGS
jgi:hypothetical protein